MRKIPELTGSSGNFKSSTTMIEVLGTVENLLEKQCKLNERKKKSRLDAIRYSVGIGEKVEERGLAVHQDYTS